MNGKALALLLLPLLALAAGPAPQAGEDDAADAAMHERMEKKLRLLRLVGAAEALDLEPAEAVKLQQTMRPFDERRKAVAKQIHAAMHTLRQAAQGDPKAQAQVDAAITSIIDGRNQMAQVDKDMFVAISQGRTPQQKAKLALFFAQLARERRGGHDGHEPGGRP